MAIVREKKMVEKEVEVAVKLICDECGEGIPFVFPEMAAEGLTEQGDDALRVDFGGGYGMLYDPLAQGEAHFLLCKKCAKKLVEFFQCFKKFMEGSQI